MRPPSGMERGKAISGYSLAPMASPHRPHVSRMRLRPFAIDNWRAEQALAETTWRAHTRSATSPTTAATQTSSRGDGPEQSRREGRNRSPRSERLLDRKTRFPWKPRSDPTRGLPPRGAQLQMVLLQRIPQRTERSGLEPTTGRGCSASCRPTRLMCRAAPGHARMCPLTRPASVRGHILGSRAALGFRANQPQRQSAIAPSVVWA